MADQAANKDQAEADRKLTAARWYMDEHCHVDKWKQWAINDGMGPEQLANLQSWSQPQVLALAEQIHRECMDNPPDPKLYPETVGYVEQYDAGLRRGAEDGPIAFAELCVQNYRNDIQKFVLSFRPEELQGHTWRELRRSKGPLKVWC